MGLTAVGAEQRSRSEVEGDEDVQEKRKGKPLAIG